MQKIYYEFKKDIRLSPQVETTKKAYHLACKEEKIASNREANNKGEASSTTAEQQKKFQEKLDKCRSEVQKVSLGEL